MKTAIVTGITGQDGAYLARLLLDKGYKVFATHRRTSSPNFWRIAELDIIVHPSLVLLEHDLTDIGSAMRLIEACRPDEVYNLAAQTFVATSFQQPIMTADTTGMGCLNLLEAIRIIDPRIRFYQSSSAEMYGKVQAVPQDENTPFYPRSPYGVSKLFAHGMSINYRESYGIFAAIGILFNHESPLRGTEFVTRKITDAVARIKHGVQQILELGNLDASRDWGYAAEYVEGMWLATQAEQPDTYVFSTNRTKTIRDFATLAFQTAGLDIIWTGTGVDECGISPATGRTLVRINPRFFRPAEVDHLKGDFAKAKRLLGWQPRTAIETLCVSMVEADLRRVATEIALRNVQTKLGLHAHSDGIAYPRIAVG